MVISIAKIRLAFQFAALSILYHLVHSRVSYIAELMICNSNSNNRSNLTVIIRYWSAKFIALLGFVYGIIVRILHTCRLFTKAFLLSAVFNNFLLN